MENTEQEFEQVEVHSEAEEAGFLNTLTDDDQDFDPSEIEQQAETDTAMLAQGAATVVTVLGVGEQLIKQFGHKDFSFDPSQVENVANSAAPLFVKYGGEMPPWMAQYKEEITFTVAAGALCFTSVSQVKHLRAADAAKEVVPPEHVEEEVKSYDVND
ncbi:hypothetical protein LL266_16810 [Vibrio anguillarum]|uniref:hypothetical protein n=1 Tax=Vibrio anguillarum TaxID=55601 RepID=UPI001D18A987|nr:hypothetical protein [Vibrio anguillarum]MCC4238152.1 hypothetical protein [Vibrio anguillarum]